LESARTGIVFCPRPWNHPRSLAPCPDEAKREHSLHNLFYTLARFQRSALTLVGNPRICDHPESSAKTGFCENTPEGGCVPASILTRSQSLPQTWRVTGRKSTYMGKRSSPVPQDHNSNPLRTNYLAYALPKDLPIACHNEAKGKRNGRSPFCAIKLKMSTLPTTAYRANGGKSRGSRNPSFSTGGKFQHVSSIESRFAETTPSPSGAGYGKPSTEGSTKSSPRSEQTEYREK
jgi:hypothetical protein